MISAVVLAAGQSKRMGRPKMVLPWESTTVIGKVVEVLRAAGLPEILVVTGAAHAEVGKALAGLPVRIVYNPDYQQGEMLSTFQTGLRALDERIEAALITLGDQPQIEQWVVESVLGEYYRTRAPLVVPSYNQRRGHPWLLERSLWPAGLDMCLPATMRDFLRDHAGNIHYVPVNTSSILQDLDTPSDYRYYQTKGGESV